MVFVQYCLEQDQGFSNNQPSQLCSEIIAALPGKVFLPGTTKYIETAQFHASENELPPCCVVRPRSCEDIATVVKKVKLSASKGDTRLAIRDGRQMRSWPNVTQVENGITIDLKELTEVSYDSGKRATSVTGDESLEKAWETLMRDDVFAAGGRYSRNAAGDMATGGSHPVFPAAPGVA